jgi:hypothetical protein
MTGTAKEHQPGENRLIGQEFLPKNFVERWADNIKNAIDKGLVGEASVRIAESILSNKRPHTPDELAAAKMTLAQNKYNYKRLNHDKSFMVDEWSRMPDGPERDALKARIDLINIQTDSLQNGNAVILTGIHTGVGDAARTLNLQKMMIDHDYSYGSMVGEANARSIAKHGRAIGDAEKAAIKELAAKLEASDSIGESIQKVVNDSAESDEIKKLFQLEVEDGNADPDFYTSDMEPDQLNAEFEKLKKMVVEVDGKMAMLPEGSKILPKLEALMSNAVGEMGEILARLGTEDVFTVLREHVPDRFAETLRTDLSDHIFNKLGEAKGYKPRKKKVPLNDKQLTEALREIERVVTRNERPKRKKQPRATVEDLRSEAKANYHTIEEDLIDRGFGGPDPIAMTFVDEIAFGKLAQILIRLGEKPNDIPLILRNAFPAVVDANLAEGLKSFRLHEYGPNRAAEKSKKKKYIKGAAEQRAFESMTDYANKHRADARREIKRAGETLIKNSESLMAVGAAGTLANLAVGDFIGGGLFGAGAVAMPWVLEHFGIKTWGDVVDSATKSKSLVASFDLSAPMNQGAKVAFAHPSMSGHAFMDAWRSANNADYAQAAQLRIINDPYHKTRMEAGLFVADYGKRGTQQRLIHSEEEWVNNHAPEGIKNIPKIGPKLHEYINNGMGWSERGYTMYLNVVRTELFDNMTRGMGYDKKQLALIADYVNVSTGRGNLGEWASKNAGMLNAIAFSPRNVVSQHQYFKHLSVGIIKGKDKARRAIVGDILRNTAAMTAVIMASQAAGATVSLDPLSSDFMKMRFGERRYDVLGGAQQILVPIVRMAAISKSAIDGDPQALRSSREALLSAVMPYFYKMSPAAGELAWLTLGMRPFDGDTEIGGRKRLSMLPDSGVNVFAPLFGRGLSESVALDYSKYGAPGIATGILKALPEAIGVRTSIIPKKKKK